MRLLTVVVLCSDALRLQAGKATAVSDAMPPGRNCSAEFQKFMVSLRIIQIATRVSEERDSSILEDNQQFVQIPMGA
jgi:hypothetical protein